MKKRRPVIRYLVVLGFTTLALTPRGQAGEQPLTYDELMKFRQISGATISQHGGWIAYSLVPDRGNGEAVVRSATSDTEYRIERGDAPEISNDEKWAMASIMPTLEEREKHQAKKGEEKPDADDGPQNGLSILDLKSGIETRLDKVEASAISENGRWLAYKLYKEEPESDQEGAEETTTEELGEGEQSAPKEDEEDKQKKEKLGTTLKLRDLNSGNEVTIEHVSQFEFAENKSLLAYSISAPEGEGNGVFLRDLRVAGSPAKVLHVASRARYTNLTWAKDVDHLGFVVAVLDDEGDPGNADVWFWKGTGDAQQAVTREQAPEGFTVPSSNELRWSRNGARLFFGFKPDDATGNTNEDEEETPFDPYDLEAILEQRKVDVWHWNDPRIMSNQKQRWEEHEKDRVYRAVVHIESGKVVPLAGLEVPEAEPCDNADFALGRSNVPYLRELTWDGEYFDLYTISLESGTRHLVVERIAEGRAQNGSLAPNGRFVLYYDAGNWHLFDGTTGETENVTADLGVPFADEDHDYPADPPGYGHTEWLADSSGVLIYDKYDIWQVFTDGSASKTLTGGLGRKQQTIFRVIDIDPEEDVIEPTASLLLSGFDDLAKDDAFFSASQANGSITTLYSAKRHRLGYVGKAEDADRIIFTRESYNEFPDLWSSKLAFQNPTKLTDANTQISQYAWGHAELVEWSSADGRPLQGVLIKPGNYEPGKRYPVLVYFYRFFSQRLHLFNEPVVNHRPSFPIYASNGYAVFLPDIRFEIGRPGFSATKCLVPGIQKLVDMGVADPEAIGLHGHSWSGYQAAYVITQTDIFAAAVAGAPVSNMTSAYSGIRWGTGLARQFQYEKSQSRIGGSLWEYPERYIENSPVFFADRINTPLLIQFGDEDEAVPWYQGIELYLACRRLDKNCIMLQYRGEPHHLKQYANKLDYSIKMKQFFDHYLKGEAAPDWMVEGVPYRGE